MNTPTHIDLAQVRMLYPAFDALPGPEVDRALREQATWLSVPAGATLFEEQAPCQGFPLVLGGEVRVARGSAQGRALELYRVGPGELCVVSASCLFGQHLLSAHGTTTAATRLAVLSPAGFDACAAHEPFRRFVFGVFADRLADLMALAEAVAFQRLDQRLAAALLGHGEVLHASHAITARLDDLQANLAQLRSIDSGQLNLAAGRLVPVLASELRDAAALRRLAAGDVAPV